ncbi:hypothetical protein Pcinc_006555 [Petrolisthes cinctipes]|nr:hypothetical protein Pcinc_006555 [Petrolisthes cinctipes]
MEGKPHSIHLLPDAKPYACHTPASVPRHWEAEVKKQLDEDIRKGILEPVPVGEATEWCARMVVVAKKSGQPRRTVDYQKLNAACKRETHHTRTPFDLVSGIPRHTYKTTSDAHWGFHQVELQEDSKRLTTFITPWGRRQVDFVGFHVGWDVFKPTEERLAAIRNFDMPAEPSLTDIRSWHGPTVVVTDWSKVGIGFVVLQQHCSCHLKEAPFCCKSGWRLALFGSRHLTSAEAGYAPVEGEVLAVAWCLRKARLFLLGCPNLIVITDHRPLVKLLGDRELKDIANPRLFGLKENTLHYRFQIKYLPGKCNSAADFLSRYPALCAPPDATDEEDANDMEGAMAAATVAALNCDNCIVLDSTTVVQAAAEDPEYQLLVAKVTAAEPLTLTPPPKYPFQHTAADLFQLDGQMYLAYADRLTGWLEIAHFPGGATSSKLLSVMRQYFQRWGAPESISTDGGTNLTSEEMSNFLERWGVERRVSSAHFPQSNGRAEAAVKSAKRLLRANTGGGGSLRTDKVSVALLQYLNTPLH